MKTQEHEEIHNRLDQLSAEFDKQILINPTKAKELLIHFMDLVSLNFKQLQK